MPSEREHLQVVWDRDCRCTAQARSGDTIDVGPGARWSPEQLFVAGVESSLMSVFLRLAQDAGVEILGYVSAAESTLDLNALRPSIVVRPCIVVDSEEDRRRVLRLLSNVAEASPIARALGSAVSIDAEVVAFAPTP